MGADLPTRTVDGTRRRRVRHPHLRRLIQRPASPRRDHPRTRLHHSAETRSAGKPKPIDFTNFSLEPDGDHRLSDWMATHLTVAVVARAVAPGQENALIAEFEPPLSLRGWENPWRQVVSAARAKCAAEARSRHHS